MSKDVELAFGPFDLVFVLFQLVYICLLFAETRLTTFLHFMFCLNKLCEVSDTF